MAKKDELENGFDPTPNPVIHTYKEALVRLWGKVEDNKESINQFLEESRKDRKDIHELINKQNDRIMYLEILAETFKEKVEQMDKVMDSYKKLETRVYTACAIIIIVIGIFEISINI